MIFTLTKSLPKLVFKEGEGAVGESWAIEYIITYSMVGLPMHVALRNRRLVFHEAHFFPPNPTNVIPPPPLYI